MEKILIIDAGHGSLDENGNYTTPPQNGKKWQHSNKGYHGGGWFYEGYSNRQLAAEFIAQATRSGFTCYPVYHPVLDTPLNVRTSLANNIANSLNAQALFISFHSNAFDGSFQGFQIYHHPTSAAGKQLATKIAQKAAPYCESFDSPSPNPVRPAGFHVLTYTQMPAVLLENLFFDNTADTDLLLDREFCSGLVSKILQGVWAYF